MRYLHVVVVNNVSKVISWKAVSLHDNWVIARALDPAQTIYYVHVFDLFLRGKSDDVGFAVGCASIGFWFQDPFARSWIPISPASFGLSGGLDGGLAGAEAPEAMAIVEKQFCVLSVQTESLRLQGVSS